MHKRQNITSHASMDSSRWLPTLGTMLPSSAHFALIVLAYFLSGCAASNPQVCSTGLTPLIREDLFFGRGLAGGGEINDAEWQRFVDEELTPRFPDGLTIEDGQGQWKGPKGLMHEKSKHVIIVVTKPLPTQFDAVRAAYKIRFHQDSVLMLETQLCGSF